MMKIIKNDCAFSFFAKGSYYKTQLKSYMGILEALSDQTHHAKPENKAGCCGKCADKMNSLNAHCGKAHTIEELVETGSDIDNFYLNRWQPDTLADYIYNEYHKFYYDHEPEITLLLEDVADHAGKNYPEVHRLEVLFSNLKNELGGHLLLEERMLFPHIKNMVKAKTDRSHVTLGIQHIAEPVSVMRDEHTAIEEILGEIRLITNNYTADDNASEGLRLLCKNLKALHENLKQHIFIENNIFYPKAILLEQELNEMGLT